MPAAAKVENTNNNGDLNRNNKQGKMSSVTSNSNNSNPLQDQQQDPTKIANTIIEKKIRNLEKRKARLLEIKALEDKGQQLVPEQVAAVKKLDSVVEMIDTLKEINKNVTDSLNDYAKKQKKLLKKEQQEKAIERHQHELERLKLLFRIETILPRISLIKQNLSHDDDAMKLEENVFQALESLAAFSEKKIHDLDGFVEKVNLILEGSKKEFSSGISNLEMKEVFVKLSESRFLGDAPEEVKLEKNSVPESNEPVSKNNPLEPEPVRETPEPETKSNSVETPVAETTNITTNQNVNRTMDIQKDPAVIASGYAYPPYSTTGPVFLTTTPNVSAIDLTLYSSHTPTFTSPEYAVLYSQNVEIAPDQVSFIDNNVLPATATGQAYYQQQNQNGAGSPLNGGSSSRTSSNGEQTPIEKQPASNGNGTSQEEVKYHNHDSSNTNGANGGVGNFKRTNNYRGGRGGGGRNFAQHQGGGSFRGRNNHNGKNFGYFNGTGNNYYPGGGNFNNVNATGNRASRGRGGGTFHRQQPPHGRPGGYRQPQQNQSATGAFPPSKQF